MKISSRLLNILKTHRSFLIAGHINPEADSIGSSLALAFGLKKLGKKDVRVLSKDPVPEILRFLPGAEMIKQRPPAREYDVLIIVDCNSMARTGYDKLPARKTVIIDHHLKPANAAGSAFYRSLAASVIEPEATAAGILVYRTLTGLHIPIDKKIATNLYAAILVDTGGFRYSNVTSESLKIASHLVEAGAKPWEVTKEIYESIPVKSMKLMAYTLSTLDVKDKIAWMTTTGAMFRKAGATAEDAEDFAEIPRKVKDIETAVFFRQDGAHSFKLSLRSKGKVDVAKIAKSFGGGGHAAAAGCKINGNLREVQGKVFRAVRKAIAENKK